MTGYITGLIGCWVFADGLASLWQYTRPEFDGSQGWLRDHSLRCVRMVCGIVLIWLGAI
jgi:hypothetical protein